MPTDEGGITRRDGECAAGIFPLRGFFNNPSSIGFDPSVCFTQPVCLIIKQ